MRRPYATFQDGTKLEFSETDGGGKVDVWATNGARQRSAHFALVWASGPEVTCDFSDGYADDKLRDVVAFVDVNAPLILELSRRETRRMCASGVTDGEFTR